MAVNIILCSLLLVALISCSTTEFRVKEPQLTSLNELVRTNRYWLQSVLSLSSRHPEQLVWSKTIIADYSSIEKAELDQLAAQYLDNRKAVITRAIPGNNGVRTAGDEIK